MAIRRGEIYFVNLNPVVGREQRGRRPVVVVSRDSLNDLPLVVTVVPGTSGTRVPADYLGNVRVPAGEANLPGETVFMTFQVRALDPGRFQDAPLGQLGSEWMAKIDQALAWTLALPVSQAPTP
jgi:mRNA interferase MazF